MPHYRTLTCKIISLSRLARLVVLICPLCVMEVNNSIAQTNSAQSNQLQISPGMYEKQMREIIGEPDRRSSEQGTVQFWYYGKSVIIVEDGIIQGVSDRGDLTSRIMQEQPKQASVKAKEPEIGDDWINPWTGPDTTKAIDIQQLVN